MPLSKRQLLFIFLSFWLHISLLDLILVNFRGPVFLWQANTQVSALLTHLGIALFSTGVVYFLAWLFAKLKKSSLMVSERIWAVCSLLLVLSIGFVIY